MGGGQKAASAAQKDEDQAEEDRERGENYS